MVRWTITRTEGRVPKPVSQQARIEALWSEWAPRMIAGWDIEHGYHEGPFEDSTGEDSEDAIATVSVDWRYIHGSVGWNLLLVAETTDADLLDTVVHEMTHILVNEMRTALLDIDHEERVCTTITRAILAARLAPRPG